jgi:hypothetical protein
VRRAFPHADATLIRQTMAYKLKDVRNSHKPKTDTIPVQEENYDKMSE